jgi:uncharacterized protein (DUF362 family)/Pyruvate/2-oxoacid:ferredoxin oxidoreductase delta subunit
MSDPKKYTVGIARCESYDPQEVEPALALALSRAGAQAPVGGEILIKANMLAPSAPDKAVTTHPEFLSALSREMIRKGNSIHIADNPGYIFSDKTKLLRATGVGALASDRVEVGILSDLGFRSVRNASFGVLEEARISNRYLDAAFVINAAKLKTHVETEISCCIKNIFGTADTATRKKCHSSVSQTVLAEAITDLFIIRPPDFNVVDAIISMEGDGPSYGKPRKTGWILAGANALAVDWVAATIMCYSDPLKIPLLKAAASRGIGPRDKSEIGLEGASWAELPSWGFKKSTSLLRLFPTFLRGTVHSFVTLRPKLETGDCVRCGICAQVCPVDAIKQNPGEYPEINRESCVKCLCCHEMCPTGAMAVGKNFLAALVGKLRNSG